MTMLAVSLDEIRRQRELGWPDFHPEDYCHRCGGRNLQSWSAPSPLWNAVMRAKGEREPFSGIVCPQCFVDLAAEAGVVTISLWRLYAERIDVELSDISPDGRRWNPETWLWEEVR